MMMDLRPPDVVVDSSVIAAWVLEDEPWHGHAVAFRDEITAGRIEPIVSAHYSFELRHALIRAARRQRISWRGILPRIRTIERFELRAMPLSVDDPALIYLCRQYGLSWADAHHVRLAADYRLPLVTLDRKLLQAVPPDIAWIEYLADRPLGDG